MTHKFNPWKTHQIHKKAMRFLLLRPIPQEQEQIKRLRTAKGTPEWDELFEQIRTGPIGYQIKVNAQAIFAEKSEFTIQHGGMLAYMFDMDVDTIFQLVEDDVICPIGKWKRAIENGATVERVLECGREHYLWWSQGVGL